MSSKPIPSRFVIRALEMENYLPTQSSGNHCVYTSKFGGRLIVLRTSGDVPAMQLLWILEASGIPYTRFQENLAKARQEPRRRFTLLNTIFAKPHPEAVEKKSRFRDLNVETSGKDSN